MPGRRVSTLSILGALAISLTTWIILVSSARAASLAQDATPTPQPEIAPPETTPLQLSISDEVCLGCHGQPGATLALQNGDVLDLSIFPEEYTNSVHGQAGYACVQCHTQVGDYPHPAFTAADLRDASLQVNQACKRCHTRQYELAQDSVHATALASGNQQAAVCTDCHSAHAVRRLNDPETHELLPATRLWIPQTCKRCHSLIYNKYKESVHGSALIGEGNPDVPTCIDCHGVHNIENPTTAYFRLRSPQICARCHTNAKIMGKYGISTDVLSTYVADFHGTTVAIFEKQSPEAETNKPVCYDCHGIHDITRTNDPAKGLQVRENLLMRCQVCHPDASANFPDAWLSHYIPSVEKTPLVYYVNLFYKLFIPGTLGGMTLLVALDFSRTARNRWLGRKIFIKKVTTPPVETQDKEPEDSKSSEAEAENG